MKTIKIIVLALILAPNIAFASIDYNLKYGQRNSEIRELQDFLIENKYLADGNNTGYFGLKTLSAVRSFQTGRAIPSTGYVGILTRTQINEELEEVMELSLQAEIEETGTTTPVTTPVVSQPQIQYIYSYQAPAQPVAQQSITNPIMEITISNPTVELTNLPNTGKYRVSFTIENGTKESEITYWNDNETHKGGVVFRAGQETSFVTDYEGTLNYQISYNNGEETKEGIINLE